MVTREHFNLPQKAILLSKTTLIFQAVNTMLMAMVIPLIFIILNKDRYV